MVAATSANNVLRTVCAHDCPDACSVLVTIEAGRVVRTVGDPQHPFTRGFLCGKVNRYAERVHSPERLLTPLRRVGAKGEGQFAPITWDEALDEIVSRWQAIMARYGGEAIAGYAYSSHQGLVNRNFTQALFHALGATRVNAGAVCDTCCGEAWELTVGPAGGTEPERVQDSDYIIAWGANLDSTNVHQIPFIDMARRKGAQLVVIDVWRTRAARRADWFIPIRVGTDAALALGIAHVLHRDNLIDHDYIQRLVLGYERWAPGGVATLHSGGCGSHYRCASQRRRNTGPGVWSGQSALHPTRPGLVTPCQWRRSHAGHHLPLRAGRGLAASWRWRPTGHSRQLQV